MKERTNEEQLDLFADLLEPMVEILSDDEIAKSMNSGDIRAKTVKLIIKKHQKSIIEILALLDGVPVCNYKVPGPVGLVKKLMVFLSNPEFKDLFTLQGQNGIAASSGSATENTGDGVV